MAARAPPSVHGRRLVAGVGESSRRDDGCGPAVVRALRGRVPADVELVEHVGDVTRLLDLWDGAELAVVVDAMRSGRADGELLRLDGADLDRAPTVRPTSSHGLSVRDAFELGRSLGRLPVRLALYLVEAGDVRPGTTLSPAVALGVDRAAQAVVRELRRPRPVPSQEA